jgi:circadian clock protein KaiC
MRSVGLDLEPCTRQGLLRFQASRPTVYGLEMHLVRMHAQIEQFQPEVVVMDPISNMVAMGSEREVNSMLSRLIDFLKGRGITAVFTTLAHPDTTEMTEVAISSLIDTWLLLRLDEFSGERNRTLFILKSRGMAHSNQVREFRLSSEGITLIEAYIGEGKVFTGSAREAQEARDRAETMARRQEIERRRRGHERQQRLLTAQIETLKVQLEQEEDELGLAETQESLREEARAVDRRRQAELRRVEAVPGRQSEAPKKNNRRKRSGS